MNLTIDIGNSAIKAALFEEGRLVNTFPITDESSIEEQLSIINYQLSIFVSTRGEVPELERALRKKGGRVLRFDRSTPVPLKNLYATPATLGYDRLAAAVGAHTLFPGEDLLVVDFGTAITFDLVTAAGEFLGGNISPGAAMRFRALNGQTATLPLGALPQVVAEFPARDTQNAIESGVATGIVAETRHYIESARKKYGRIKIIFTGGDADYFAGRVNFPIFATSDLVFYGLNAILEYNR